MKTPQQLDADCSRLTRVYATTYYTQRDALKVIADLYLDGVIKADKHNNFPMKAVGKGRNWRVVVA